MKGRTPRDPLWRAVHEDARPSERDISRTDHAAHGSPLLQRRDGRRRGMGSWRWISINTEPLFHEGDPRLMGMVASFAEISERKRTEEALRASEHRWHSLTDALPELIWTSRPDGSFEYLSPQLAGIHRHAGKRDSRPAAAASAAPRRARGNHANWLASLQRGTDFAFDHQIARADGTYRCSTPAPVPARRFRDRIKWLGTSTDVTELRPGQGGGGVREPRKDEFSPREPRDPDADDASWDDGSHAGIRSSARAARLAEQVKSAGETCSASSTACSTSPRWPRASSSSSTRALPARELARSCGRSGARASKGAGAESVSRRRRSRAGDGRPPAGCARC